MIYLRNGSAGDAHDFLKSRFFEFKGKLEGVYPCNYYALNWNSYDNKATMWCYKYTNKQLKVMESGDGSHLMFFKSQLKYFKTKTKFEDDGSVLPYYFYKNRKVTIRENDNTKKYELFID